MAIAFDVAVNGGIVNPGTSLTWSHTCTGSNLLLLVATEGDLVSDVITGVTYNSVAMTKINAVQPTGGRWLSFWYLLEPATGANNVVATASSSIIIQGKSSSYTGVKQSGFPDATTTGSASAATSLTTTLTTVADNCWTALTGNNIGSSSVAAGTGTTMRISGGDGQEYSIFDSNGVITPAGSASLEFTWTTNQNAKSIMVSFAPFVAVTDKGGALMMSHLAIN